MLKQRVLTASVLVALALWAILGWSGEAFALGFAGVAALAAWEWSALAGVGALTARLAYVALVAALLLGVAFTPVGAGPTLLWAAVPWWVLAAVAVLRYPAGDRFWARRAPRLAAGVLVLVPAWTALVGLRGDGSGAVLVLYLMGVIWTADTAAYFCGRRWGRRKLAPGVSPGKTWEGFYGALAGGAALAAASAVPLGYGGQQLPGFLLLALATVVSSVLGDLFESLVKRVAGIKDSGAILPGHGGIMDRIDSLTAGAPIFVVGLGLLGSPA